MKQKTESLKDAVTELQSSVRRLPWHLQIVTLRIVLLQLELDEVRSAQRGAAS